MNEERAKALQEFFPKSVARRLAVQTEDMADDEFGQFLAKRRTRMSGSPSTPAPGTPARPETP